MRGAAGVLVLVSVLALTACGNDNEGCPQSLGDIEPVSMSVPMPAPIPAPRPPAPAPRPPAPKAPAPAPKAPAPKAPAPQPAVPKVAPKRYVPPPPPPIYRPVDRTPTRDYRTIYVQSHNDHTPLLWMLAMNGAFDGPRPVQECDD